jgi:hypothetical protein
VSSARFLHNVSPHLVSVDRFRTTGTVGGGGFLVLDNHLHVLLRLYPAVGAD